jgi:hypothetical protein
MASSAAVNTWQFSDLQITAMNNQEGRAAVELLDRRRMTTSGVSGHPYHRNGMAYVGRHLPNVETQMQSLTMDGTLGGTGHWFRLGISLRA